MFVRKISISATVCALSACYFQKYPRTLDPDDTYRVGGGGGVGGTRGMNAFRKSRRDVKYF